MKIKEITSAVPVTGGSDSAKYDALSGGGQMGALIRSLDWADTPLGPVELWPQSLRTTVSLCLSSTFPILITWGPENVQIYNDSYRPICGAKHPQAMGQKFNDCWATALPVVGEIFARAWSGEGSYIENQRMFLDRDGYLEEAFMTFSFSPIRDESGEVGGLFHPITETTDGMLSARRTQAVRDFSTQISKAQTENEIVDFAQKTYGACNLDLPFFLIYQRDESGKSARLIKSVGLPSGTVSTPDSIDLENDDQQTWPLAEVTRSKKVKLVSDLERLWGPLICEPYPEALREAVILPILVPGVDHPFGFLIAGVSARRAFDANYLGFYESFGNAVNTAFTNVRAYEQEKKRAAALAEIDRAKTVFFSNVSHEFRTPLTLMLGPLEDNLAHPNLSLGPEHKERDELAYRSARRLLKLVNSLLDFSRIEAGRMKAVFRPTDLSKLTVELSGMFRAAIEKAGLKLIVETSGLHESVYVDREMWEKVVLNLLSNAFKFTLHGEIEVRLTQANGWARLSVRDTGVGVPTTEIPHLFERFHRVEGAQGRTHEGSGIGLALTQELVKLHGGTNSVRSELGAGSEFTVEIPLGKEHLPANLLGSAKEGEAIEAKGAEFVEEALRWLPDSQTSSVSFDAPLKGKKRARILIVDDNSDMRGYVKNLLQPHFDIEAVGDGEAALTSATHNAPDLILSDVMMPKMDGLELVKRLRENPKTKGIPCILLSARAGEESRIEGLETGADDYLIKPFSAKELLARVMTHLEIGRLRAESNFQRENIYKVFMQAPAAVALLKGEKLTFDIANSQYLALIGKEDSIIGKPLREALPEMEEETHLIFEKVYRTGQSFVANEYEATLDRLGRQERKGYFSFVVEPMKDLAGETEAILIFGYEVTEQVTARREKERLTSKLQEALHSRDEFMAIASHELKSPITSISLQLQLTKKRIQTELGQASSSEKLIDKSIKVTNRLAGLVENLLDVAQMQAGILAFSFQTMNVEAVIREAVIHVSEQLERAECSVRVEVAPNLVVRWDPARIEQVIVNLISNAIKYAPGHPIQIRVSVEGATAVLVVQDFGPGILKELQEKIFERFERANVSHNVSGLGLGLYIVKQIVTGHQGNIRVESEEGKGTKFIIELPLLLRH